jgi:hypothetical protein
MVRAAGRGLRTPAAAPDEAARADGPAVPVAAPPPPTAGAPDGGGGV